MNEYVPLDWDNQSGSIIKVIGVGGGGCNAVKNMYNMGIEGVDFIVCNTDQQVLVKSPIVNKVQLGAALTKGRGAGCDPEQGRKAALESIDAIREMIANNTEMLFITAGMGGGTGTGAAPVIAKEARELGILTVAIVTLPFKDEGIDPFNRAVAGIRELQQYVDSLLIINNQKLYEIYPNLSVFDAFPKADDIVSTAAKGIAEIITVEGYINVDFADVKMVMKDSGVAVMGTGRASGDKRGFEAAELALNSPLLSDSDISGARNILVNVSSGSKNALKMTELSDIMDYVNKASGGKANFKRGVVLDSRLDDEICVTIVATGFAMSSIPELDIYLPEKKEVVHMTDAGAVSDGLTKKEVFTISDEPFPIQDSFNLQSEGLTVHEIELTDGHNEMQVSERSSEGQVAKQSQQVQTTIPYPVAPLPHPQKDISYLEEIPAYERKKLNLTQNNTSDQASTEISRHKLKEGEDGFKFSSNNSFLDQIAD